MGNISTPYTAAGIDMALWLIGEIQQSQGDHEGNGAVLYTQFHRHCQGFPLGQTRHPAGRQAETNTGQIQQDGCRPRLLQELPDLVANTVHQRHDQHRQHNAAEDTHNALGLAGNFRLTGTNHHPDGDREEHDANQHAHGFPDRQHNVLLGPHVVLKGNIGKQRQGKNGDQAGADGQYYGEGNVAPREQHKQIRGGASGAGGDDHQSDRYGRRNRQQRGQHEGDERHDENLGNGADDHPFRIHRHLAEVSYRQGHADTDHDDEQSNRQSCRDKRAGFHNASGCFCFYCNQPMKSSTHSPLSGD